MPDAIAIVTGASSGVGKAIAEGLASTLSAIALIGRDERRLAETASAVVRAGGEAACFPADFRSRRELEELGEQMAHTYPAVRLLVHAAGVFVSGTVEELELEDFDQAMAVNTRAPLALTRCLLPSLESGRGQVLFVNSSAVGQKRAGLSAYTASKSALLACADSLRQEVNHRGIRVTTLFLGATATPMQRTIYERDGREYRPQSLLQPSAVARAVRSLVRLPPEAELTDLYLRPSNPHR